VGKEGTWGRAGWEKWHVEMERTMVHLRSKMLQNMKVKGCETERSNLQGFSGLYERIWIQ
jgi:hypothetical protein